MNGLRRIHPQLTTIHLRSDAVSRCIKVLVQQLGRHGEPNAYQCSQHCHSHYSHPRRYTPLKSWLARNVAVWMAMPPQCRARGVFNSNLNYYASQSEDDGLVLATVCTLIPTPPSVTNVVRFCEVGPLGHYLCNMPLSDIPSSSLMLITLQS